MVNQYEIGLNPDEPLEAFMKLLALMAVGVIGLAVINVTDRRRSFGATVDGRELADAESCFIVRRTCGSYLPGVFAVCRDCKGDLLYSWLHLTTEP